LLFGGDAAWTATGVTDLGHLPEKIEKHKNSAKHIRNVIDLAMIGKVNIAVVPDRPLVRDQIRTLLEYSYELGV
jgi:hypothetical protein